MSVALGAWPIPQSLGSQAGTSLKICQPATSPVNPPGKHHERRGSLLGFVEAPFRCIYCIYIISYHIISYWFILIHIDSYYPVVTFPYDFMIIPSLCHYENHCYIVYWLNLLVGSSSVSRKHALSNGKTLLSSVGCTTQKKCQNVCVCVFSLSFSGQNSFVYDIFMTFLVSLCRNTRECETCGIFGSALPFPVSPAQWELRQEVLIPQSRQSHLAKWSPLFGSAFSQLFSMVFWTNPNGFSFIANW